MVSVYTLLQDGKSDCIAIILCWRVNFVPPQLGWRPGNESLTYSGSFSLGRGYYFRRACVWSCNSILSRLVITQ